MPNVKNGRNKIGESKATLVIQPLSSFFFSASEKPGRAPCLFSVAVAVGTRSIDLDMSMALKSLQEGADLFFAEDISSRLCGVRGIKTKCHSPIQFFVSRDEELVVKTVIRPGPSAQVTSTIPKDNSGSRVGVGHDGLDKGKWSVGKRKVSGKEL